MTSKGTRIAPSLPGGAGQRLVESLDESECLRLLGAGRVGRLAYTGREGTAVLPVVYKLHEGSVVFHTLQGTFTEEDLRTGIAAVTGKQVTYTDLSPKEHRAALIATGLPEELASFLVAVEQDIKHGLLSDVTGDLRTLTGRPTTPIRDTVAGVVSSL